MYGCQQNLLHLEELETNILEFLCEQVNKLVNCAIYKLRQAYFTFGVVYTNGYELMSEMKSNIHGKVLYSQVAQQAIAGVAESFKSYAQLLSMFYKGELSEKPKLPKYRKKGGLAGLTYPKQALEFDIETGLIRLPLGKEFKAWFDREEIHIPLPTNLRFERIRELRILPRNRCFYVEFVYSCQDVNPCVDRSRVLGIDPGLNNWLTCVSNIGKSFIIDGKNVKSKNQWYNKRVANIKSGKPPGFWSNELAAITERRNRQMRDAINKAARFVVNWCFKYQIGTLVFGWNQRNKDSIELGKKNNQEFVQIPSAKLKERLKQLCEQHGIEFIETEGSYTSKASFLDGDFLPTYGAKPKEWKASGKRGKKGDGLGRGQYQTKKGWRINADCNGAANILRKVSAQLGFSLAEVSRVVLTLPQRYDLSSLNKSYRKRSVVSLDQRGETA